MGQLIDGRTLAKAIRQKVKERVAPLPTKPGLAVFLIGDDPASHTYVALKEKACHEAGIRFEKYAYSAETAEEALIKKIQELNARADITGILVQLPLPAQNEDRVVAAIDPNKDVDGFHPENLRRLDAGEAGLVSPVALGVMKLMESTGEAVSGRHAAIVAGALFGKPIAKLLAERAVTVEIISPDNPELPFKTKTADLLIVAAGRPGLITGEAVKPGAIVIDIGTTRVGEKILGDVDQASVAPVANYLTPVPGGVGPMTVAMLLVNVLKAEQLQRSKPHV